MNKTSIITADDHPLLLKGLNDFLIEKGYNIIGSANDGREAYDLIINEKPGIAILDIQMPYLSGIDIAQKCKTNCSDVKIILITLHKERELYQQAKELNIFGYILKEFALEEIETCLENVSNNKHYFSPKIVGKLDKVNTALSALELLTPSEKKILKLIGKDKTNKEIASLLFISYRTVEKHRSNIITKLELEHKTNSLLIWAKQHYEQLK
ncbi:response regulator transcription factor [Rasiella rasia]|uniref:Response regulator transcription factor n=1 Tax=Rasiella rasia TaxID=2744027 RepID=A0A6G6GPN9_9FLAO|nr:response regulator transcription factor [Rasiella rasia]QIE59681.1 response regulator transcription factor [Rasiella rasia]